MNEAGLTTMEIKKLIDEEFMNAIVEQMMNDPESLDRLAQEVASELAGVLKEDPSFKKKMSEAAGRSPELKKKIAQRIGKKIKD